MKNLLILSVFFVLSYQLFADGCFFSRGPQYYVTAPSQKAVILWNNGQEKMLLSTKMQSEKFGDFAWIIPIKSTIKPQVDLADIEIFRTLNRFLRPRRRSSFGFGCSASLQVQVDSIQIFETKELDIFDLTILKASDPNALFDWLKQHYFNIPERARHILSDYTNDDFFFIAVKLDLANQHRQAVDLLHQYHYYDTLEQLTSRETEIPYYYHRADQANSLAAEILENAVQNKPYDRSWDEIITETEYHRLRLNEPLSESDLHVFKTQLKGITRSMLNMKCGIANPLLITFNTDAAFFPLKISQINQGFVSIDLFTLSQKKLLDNSDFLHLEKQKLVSKKMKEMLSPYIPTEDFRYVTLFTYHGESIDFTHDIFFDEKNTPAIDSMIESLLLAF